MEIYVDNRERDLILKMQMNCLTFEVKTLDIGDIHIVDEKTKEIYVIFERKTLEDLSSSITDGRYKEQKQRLLHSISSHIRKIYILEGDDIDRFHLGKPIFEGVMVNTVIRDKIMIYRTKDLEETMEIILKTKRCLEKHYEQIVAERMEKGNEGLEYQVFKTMKKENLDEKVGFKAMLSIVFTILSRHRALRCLPA
jgi:ERCC4-type nuclease